MSLKMITSDRRFWPLFWTQFLGALNDNFLKNALVVMVTFKGFSLMGLGPSSVVALAGGVFILPFFLFSPIAGLIADKTEKSRLVRATKLWEVMIMLVGALGFYFESLSLLLAVLFMAGMQSTLFGPVKYSMIPDLVEPGELVEANAYVEMGTFLAILLGTIGGGIMISLPNGEYWIMTALLVTALVGLYTSYRVTPVKIACPDLEIEFNPIPEMGRLYGILRQSKAVFNSVLAISWFWFFGAAVLSLLPTYCKDFLGAGEQVVTCFLAMFTIGIGIGSILCEKLSFKRVELGLVPIGSLGMTIFLADLYFARPDWPITATTLLSLSEFLGTSIGIRLLVDFMLMSIFGGFFILPLYTLIQERSAPESRSRVIAANNIANSLFMVVASVFIMALHAFGYGYPQIFMTLAIMNLVAAIYIYSVVPEFALRFFSWVLARALYRIRCQGEENIPRTGPAILVCNHVSFVDWLIISALVRRPVRYVMYHKFFDVPLLRYLMKQAKVIPIAGARENPKVLEEAFEKISHELRDGEIVCIFPEGQLTRHGELNEFKTGIEKILERDPVPVIPMALQGLWGTFFSFGRGPALLKLPRHWMKRVKLVVGKAIPANGASAESLSHEVRGLLGEPTKSA
jgi:1-acyl-sn-glycerol-3-phosphate acyltransferase